MGEDKEFGSILEKGLDKFAYTLDFGLSSESIGYHEVTNFAVV